MSQSNDAMVISDQSDKFDMSGKSDATTLVDIQDANNAVTYWKVLQPSNKHHNFQWQAGLNKLGANETFNGDYFVECAGGRLYYSDANNLQVWSHHGDHIQAIREPTELPEFKCVRLYGKKAANMLELGSKVYSLYDPQTYAKFGWDIKNNQFIVYWAAVTGRVEFLDWWVSQGNVLTDLQLYECKQSADTYDQQHVMSWLKKYESIQEKQDCDAACTDV
jgi:hypothetical protein